MTNPCNLRSRLALAAAVALAAAAGCGDGKKTYPVAGRFVWQDGSPAKELSGGMVIFQCDGEQISSKGPIREDGTFVLGTYKLEDGTVAGKHKVSVVQPSADWGDNPPLQVVHKKYEGMGTTDLEVTVEPKSNDVLLKVEPGAWMLKKTRK
jgi:hypothetical protein